MLIASETEGGKAGKELLKFVAFERDGLLAEVFHALRWLPSLGCSVLSSRPAIRHASFSSSQRSCSWRPAEPSTTHLPPRYDDASDRQSQRAARPRRGH